MSAGQGLVLVCQVSDSSMRSYQAFMGNIMRSTVRLGELLRRLMTTDLFYKKKPFRWGHNR